MAVIQNVRPTCIKEPYWINRICEYSPPRQVTRAHRTLGRHQLSGNRADADDADDYATMPSSHNYGDLICASRFAVFWRQQFLRRKHSCHGTFFFRLCCERANTQSLQPSNIVRRCGALFSPYCVSLSLAVSLCVVSAFVSWHNENINWNANEVRALGWDYLFTFQRFVCLGVFVIRVIRANLDSFIREPDWNDCGPTIVCRTRMMMNAVMWFFFTLCAIQIPSKLLGESNIYIIIWSSKVQHFTMHSITYYMNWNVPALCNRGRPNNTNQIYSERLVRH